MLIDDCDSMIKSRVSIRKFKKATIPDNDINEIIEIGTKSPSAGNCQPWRIVVVKDAATREKLAEAAWGQSFVAKAPVILVVCAVPTESKERYSERGETLYVLHDTAALATSLLLSAHFKGYGACWVANSCQKLGQSWTLIRLVFEKKVPYSQCHKSSTLLTSRTVSEICLFITSPSLMMHSSKRITSLVKVPSQHI
ncbi:MAG: nitroreductase family protein [Candidatus Thorarchaeota archaeon]